MQRNINRIKVMFSQFPNWRNILSGRTFSKKGKFLFVFHFDFDQNTIIQNFIYGKNKILQISQEHYFSFIPLFFWQWQVTFKRFLQSNVLPVATALKSVNVAPELKTWALKTKTIRTATHH